MKACDCKCVHAWTDCRTDGQVKRLGCEDFIQDLQAADDMRGRCIIVTPSKSANAGLRGTGSPWHRDTVPGHSMHNGRTL